MRAMPSVRDVRSRRWVVAAVEHLAQAGLFFVDQVTSSFEKNGLVVTVIYLLAGR